MYSISDRQSAKFKLQSALLECAGELACTLTLPTTQFEHCAVSASLYLSSDQPQPLQTLATRCFTKLISVDPDTVWLVLRQLAPPSPDLATPPGPALKPYRFPDNPESSKYVKNVEPLLLQTFK